MMRSESDTTIATTPPLTPPPRTDYLAQDQDDDGGCPGQECAGCAVAMVLCAVGAAAVFIPGALSIYGIVLAANAFAGIPACAQPYRAWLIVMIVLLLGTASYKNKTKKDNKDGRSLGKDICAGLVAGLLIPLLGYFLVVRKVDDQDHCDVDADLRRWAMWVVYFYAAWGITVMVRGVLIQCYSTA